MSPPPPPPAPLPVSVIHSKALKHILHVKLLLTSTALFVCLKLSLGLSTLLTDLEFAANSPAGQKGMI